MRIAHISDCYLPRLGGIERQVNDLALRQLAAGHDVEVITSVGGDPMEGPLRIHRPSRRITDNNIRYAHTPKGLAALREGAFDIVHVHMSMWSPLAFFAARYACGSGIPVAATVHSMWAYATPLFRASAVASNWRHWPMAWSAVSEAAARPLRAVLGADASITVVPNGISVGCWQLPEATQARNPQRIVIATVMRLAARKRPRQFARMLAAVRQLVPDHIQLEALVIGDGPLRGRLESDLHRYGIDTWVRLTGVMNAAEIAQSYRDVDVYVAPATLESFGIAALEARSAGLPVVAYTRTGVADFIQDGRNGLLAEDDDGMVHALYRLIADPGLRAAIAAHNRAQDPAVSWPHVLERCDDLYAHAGALCAAPPASRATLEVRP